MIYMNRKDRMIEHGHFFKDRYKFHVMPSPGYHWTLEVSRVCGWWAWQDFSQHDAPRSFCNWAKNTKNALLLNSKFWKQSGRLVHEQVVLDKFGKLDVVAPLTWKSDKYFFQVLSDISLYLVQSSSFFICFQERKAPRRFMRTRLKSLLQKRQDGATHKDLAVFFGPKIGSAIGVVLDTKSLRWCRWSRFFSFRAFRMVLLQFLVSQPAFFFFSAGANASQTREVVGPWERAGECAYKEQIIQAQVPLLVKGVGLPENDRKTMKHPPNPRVHHHLYHHHIIIIYIMTVSPFSDETIYSLWMFLHYL